MRKLRLLAIWAAILVQQSVNWRIVESLRRQTETKETEQRLLVNMTLLPRDSSMGAVCLDGSPPAYHLHRGYGVGINNWLLQFEERAAKNSENAKKQTCPHTMGCISSVRRQKEMGGGWCNDLLSCLERSRTRRGSTRYMNRFEVFSGILSDDPTKNPGFYNWNRVKLRYCDGASFAGDSEYINGTTVLHFRGKRIWEAIIDDLLPKGLMNAQKALLSGCSAGGLAAFLHCDALSQMLPDSVIIKCMSDAGFFLDVKDITGNDTIRTLFNGVVNLQGVQNNLNKVCLASHFFPSQCFFPQYNLPFIKNPFFILNSAYDVYQFHHIFVPPSADLIGHWNHCKSDPTSCTPSQISILQGFRIQMLTALATFETSEIEGMFINSCFAHCQSELQDSWYAEDSPRIHNKTIAEDVGDWYFGRGITKEVDCPYPCDHTCQNLIPGIEPDVI